MKTTNVVFNLLIPCATAKRFDPDVIAQLFDVALAAIVCIAVRDVPDQGKNLPICRKVEISKAFTVLYKFSLVLVLVMYVPLIKIRACEPDRREHEHILCNNFRCSGNFLRSIRPLLSKLLTLKNPENSCKWYERRKKFTAF